MTGCGKRLSQPEEIGFRVEAGTQDRPNSQEGHRVVQAEGPSWIQEGREDCQGGWSSSYREAGRDRARQGPGVRLCSHGPAARILPQDLLCQVQHVHHGTLAS